MCDQVDQVVPAHHVDDINEVHELDPVHQVDHKDEYTVPHITSHHITSHHITSHHITSHCDDIGRFLGRHRSFLAVLAVFDGCWSLFGSIFAKNVRFSLVFTRDSWPPGTLHRFYSFLLLSTPFRRFRRQARQNRPRVPRAGEQDDGSLPQTPSNYFTKPSWTRVHGLKAGASAVSSVTLQ